MSTKTNPTLNPINFTALPVTAKLSIKKEVNIMNRSFYILFGGIALGWIACMTILISYMFQS